MTDQAPKRITINELLANSANLVAADQCAFFYDWFCADSGLKNRALVLIDKLQFLVAEGLIDGDANYVWFKNNCPMSGHTYDDMRISRISNEEFLGGFCFASGHTGETHKADFWLIDKKHDMVNQKFRNWPDMKKALKTDEAVRNKIKEHYKQV